LQCGADREGFMVDRRTFIARTALGGFGLFL
jgi:hypothetical protein